MEQSRALSYAGAQDREADLDGNGKHLSLAAHRVPAGQQQTENPLSLLVEEPAEVLVVAPPASEFLFPGPLGTGELCQAVLIVEEQPLALLGLELLDLPLQPGERLV